MTETVLHASIGLTILHVHADASSVSGTVLQESFSVKKIANAIVIENLVLQHKFGVQSTASATVLKFQTAIRRVPIGNSIP